MPRARRMIRPPGVMHHTDPVGRSGRSAPPSDACPVHCSPDTSRFMAEFRLKASTDMAHHAALAPNSSRRHPLPMEPSHSSATLWTSSPLPHLCLDLRSTHLPQCSGWSPRRRPCTSLCWTAYQPRGTGSSICPSIPGRGCSINRSLRSYQPILRAVLGVPYPVGHEGHTADPCPHDAPQPCGTASASLARRPRTPHGVNSVGSRRPQPRTQSPRTARLYPPRSTGSNSRWYPAVSDLSSHLLHPRRQTAQRSNQHSQLLMARRYVAVPKLRMHDQLGL